jgi:serine/threonine protein kinase
VNVSQDTLHIAPRPRACPVRESVRVELIDFTLTSALDETYERIRAATYAVPESVSHTGRDLISRLIDVDPSHRAMHEEIWQHAFFENVEWDTVATMPITLEPMSDPNETKTHCIVIWSASFFVLNK